MFTRNRSLAWVLALFAIAGAIVLVMFLARGQGRSFTVRGIVRAPYDGNVISIQHEEIPGFMPAMTMPFNVDGTEVRDLSPGDRVEFKFHVSNDSSRATQFRKLPGEPAAVAVSGGKGEVAPFRRLRAGDRVPAFALIDQDGKTLTDADLEGNATIVTFIFTRCPVPEFCPLIGKKFQALQAELAKSNRDARLLSISIDPEYDQPAILRSYGVALGADFGRWRFATGKPDQVATLAKLFAVRTERTGGTLDHTLATALIGPDRTVVEIWRGNAWKPAEILAKLGETRPAG
jgi:protein SCO1